MNPELAPRTTMNGKPILRVPVKTVLNLESLFAEKLLSDGPALALGEGCAYSCAFCYVPAVYQKLDRIREAIANYNAANKTALRHEDFVILRNEALAILERQLTAKPYKADKADRRVLYTSPADDVAANMDLVKHTAEAVALILRHTNWQIRLLSKSNLLPKLAAILVDGAASESAGYSVQDVMERTIWGVSTGTLDDRLAKAFEEGAPLVSKRIASLHVLQDNGFRTYGMICPSLPLDHYVEYEQMAEAFASALRYDRMEHVWAEVINLRGESFRRTYTALGNAGFARAAFLVDRVSSDSRHWEDYNRRTFEAHAKVTSAWIGKLRFLTYVDKSTLAWWQLRIAAGAVLLGKEAHK